MSVKLLPKEIRSLIRSGIAINTLVDCVEALVQNAIDANANCVAVRIDVPFYKIQVIDNGKGINKNDLELIGERYATSKCHSLGDLGNTNYYGYRGEALASLCEISQELIVASRDEHGEKTYAKTFRGSSSRIDVATLKRPSTGTTVTVSGFLYNLPVRQAVISGTMELERVRRSLECLAISNPTISFSLRDDSSDAWCFRVPKTDSVVTTFCQIFGSAWASTLKPVGGNTPPFSISGFFSLKGHRNKNYQFLYVHKRRISYHRLNETINQLFGAVFGGRACGISTSPRRGLDANEKYPVFVLKIECAAEFYDVGFHPSKTVVEFKKYDVLVELVKSTLIAFLSKNLETTTSQEILQDVSQILTDSRPEDTLKISAQNYKHSLHSLAAKRAYKPEASVEIEDIARKRFSDTPTCMDKTPMDTPRNPVHTTETNVKSISSYAEDSNLIRHLPTDRFGVFSKPSPDLSRPIHLSPALDHQRAALGKFINVKKRQERIGKAIADLKKFSHKVRHTESTPHVAFFDQTENPKSNSGQDSGEGTIVTQNRKGTSIAERSLGNPFASPINISSASTKAKTPSESNLHQIGVFMTSDTILELPSSLETSPHRYFPERNPRPNCRIITPNVSQQLTVNPLALEDYQCSDSFDLPSINQAALDSSRSREIEKTKTACSTNVHLNTANLATGDAHLETVSKLHDSESSCLQSRISTHDCGIPNLNMGCEVSLEEKRQWFLGTEPVTKRDIYVNGETGHSYYGKPPASPTPSLTSTLVAGHPLPLDTSISDNQLATSVLPTRPWRSRMPDSDRNGSGDDTSKVGEEHSVERMLQTWENPVFKVDPLLKTFGQTGGINNLSTLGFQPYVFQKDIFENITVIAQVDRKFIVCSTQQDGENDKAPTRRLLVAFDQHAVHERIRLEDLIRDAENSSGSNRLQTTELDPPLILHLPSHVARVCLGHQKELISKGVTLTACNETDGEHTPVCVGQIPSCLVETRKERADSPTVESSVIENLLCELVETLENTGSVGADMPRIVVDALKSQACHGAIKFGDLLSVADCRNLIKLLSQCKLPFFCAHGRPNIVPLFDYNLLSDTGVEVMKPNLLKLVGKMKKT